MMSVNENPSSDPTMDESTLRPVRVLGISAYYHDSAAALVVDGRIVAAAQEERFNRVKGSEVLPSQTMDWILSSQGLTPDDIDAVVFYESPFTKLDRLLSTKLVGRARALPSFIQAMRTWLPNKLWAESHIRKELGKDVDVLFCDHHLSHAASAFYASPFDEAAILTVDGVGEWSTTMIAQGHGNEITMIEDIEFPNSVGLLYSAFTVYCGFKVNSGEYKLMGLAPFGKPRFAEIIKSEIVHLAKDGSFSLNPKYFDYLYGDRTYTPDFEALFGAAARKPEEPISELYADVAASIQLVCDELVVGLARRAREVTGSRRLCLAGGVALNVVSIGNLERLGIFDEIWVQPAAGDAGGALGAALWASHTLLGVGRQVAPDDSMRGAFLGPFPDYDGKSVASVIDEYGAVAEQYEDEQALAQRVAQLVSDGAVVAICRGAMEFGPRALGARSILADARDPGTQRRLNLKTKFREGFRPFAPIVLADRTDDYFISDGRRSPYMLTTYHVRPELRTALSPQSGTPFERVSAVRSVIPAVTHLDYSARVQTVDEARNPFLHQILTQFDAITGCPVLVNTSFNVRGEPIVASVTDAVECFIATDIDAIVIGDHLIVRSSQTGTITAQRASARKDD
jgi:carbamoyltransferase